MAGYKTPANRRAAVHAFDNKPVNSVAPAVTGTTTVGQTLTCSNGTWSKSPAFAFQWSRSGVAIDGATASTRVLAGADTGALMRCTVRATTAGVSEVATSAPSAAVIA